MPNGEGLPFLILRSKFTWVAERLRRASGGRVPRTPVIGNGAGETMVLSAGGAAAQSSVGPPLTLVLRVEPGILSKTEAVPRRLSLER